jgi:hypothetical protein
VAALKQLDMKATALHGIVLIFLLVFKLFILRGPFVKFVDWWQCAAVMQREAVTVMPNCSGGGSVVVA